MFEQSTNETIFVEQDKSELVIEPKQVVTQ